MLFCRLSDTHCLKVAAKAAVPYILKCSYLDQQHAMAVHGSPKLAVLLTGNLFVQKRYVVDHQHHYMWLYKAGVVVMAVAEMTSMLQHSNSMKCNHDKFKHCYLSLTA